MNGFMRILRLIFLAFLFSQLFQFLPAQSGQEPAYVEWDALSSLPSVGDQNQPIGVAGPVAGIHNDVLIVAGGANFDQPYWENEKKYFDDIWVMFSEQDGTFNWREGGKLEHPVAYSAVVTSPMGLIAMGGCDSETTYSDVMLLTWDPEKQQVRIEYLPHLPQPCANGSAAMIGDQIYLAGGTESLELSSAMANFWRLDLSKYGREDFQWEILPTWPGPERGFNITVAQHSGYADCIYVMSGRKDSGQPGRWEVLQDVYEFNAMNFSSGEGDPWRKRSPMPAARMAGAGLGVGQSHIYILAGADGSLYWQADSLRELHPGFPRQILAYHTITDNWFEAGTMPANQVGTHAFNWGEQMILVSGEIKPRTRTPDIWSIKTLRTAQSFGWINLGAILIYLLILVGIGVFFSFRNKSTEDFFRGGQRIPWWAAGCSIFATMLSSITFMSIPAKAYATDWLYFLLNMAIIALAPFIIYFILPFFRRIDATSAYQYLEMRFNLAARLFASASYIFFQVGRMAIVMYLPSLALAAVTPVSIETSILIMGVLSIIYCTLGGLEAVIWTDTIQTIVLLGGAVLSLIVILIGLDNGISEFMNTGIADGKFRMVEWSWDYTTAVLWVVIIGGLAQQLIPYSSDQGVVQRYMSVSTRKKAASSIWTNAGLSFFATVLFFSVGTALYVFYKKNPVSLDPSYQTDAVFPLFIAQNLPVGLAGIVIAGIFAAAQSTISTSMNSISTAFTTDFIRRFDLISSEKGYLNLARITTMMAGILGTSFALVIAYADIISLFDSYLSILGLLGGAMCGLFMLGIFTSRSNGKGALIGAVGGAVTLWLVQQYTDVSFLLYAAIGVIGTFVLGYLASFMFPGDVKNTEGLNIHSVK